MDNLVILNKLRNLRFSLGDLSVDFGELTPTLKIRRIQIRENWANEIEAMYDGA